MAITRYVDANIATGTGDGVLEANAYASLSAGNVAEEAANGDLETATETMTFECRGTANTADATAVTVDGWTTSEAYDLTIRAESGYRHSGVWKTTGGCYRLELATSSNPCINVNVSYVTLDGLQILLTGSTTGVGVATGGAHSLLVENCIVRSTNTASSVEGIYATACDNVCFRNNVIYGFDATTGVGIRHDYGGSSSYDKYIYNNTVYDCTTGIEVGGSLTWASTHLYNNLVYGCGTDYSINSTDSNDNNISEDATSPDVAHRSATITFSDATGTPPDFNLVAGDTDAIEDGTDLDSSSPWAVTTDIKGTARDATSPDIGAFEYVASGNTGTGALSIQPIAVSGSGTVDVDGTGNAALQPLAISGAGTVDVEGSGNAALQPITVAGVGTTINDSTGTGALALQPIAISGSGTVDVDGTGNAALQPLAIAGVGTVAIDGSGSAALQPLAIAGVGTVTGGDVTGSGNAALQPIALSGVGDVAIDGTGNAALQPLVIAGVGVVTGGAVTGTGALSIQPIALSGVGTVDIDGSGNAALQPLVIAGVGTTINDSTGTGALSIQPIALSGSGTVDIDGTGNAALQPLVIAGVGTVDVDGSGSAALQPLAIAGVGTVAITGTGALALQPLAVSGADSENSTTYIFNVESLITQTHDVESLVPGTYNVDSYV